jgi:hypothetical protein
MMVYIIFYTLQYNEYIISPSYQNKTTENKTLYASILCVYLVGLTKEKKTKVTLKMHGMKDFFNQLLHATKLRFVQLYYFKNTRAPMPKLPHSS